MASTFKQVAGQWSMLSKRERVMIFLVGLFAIVGFIDTYMTDPVRQQIKIAEDEVLKLQENVSKVRLEIATLKQGAPNSATPIQQDIDKLRGEINTQQQRLTALGDMMVSPKEILDLMKNLLIQHNDVKVIELESVPPVSFVKKHLSTGDGMNDAQQAADMQAANVYQHSIHLKVQGSYLAVMNYVADLKKLGAMIAWEKAEMKSKYPQTELSLDVYTLSTETAWLGI